MQDMDFQGITFSVEGNIGVGKTTLLRDILNADADSSIEDIFNLVPEPVESWQEVERLGDSNQNNFNVLAEFYRDPKRYAYTFQNYVFMTRFLQEKTTREARFPLRIMERSVCSDRNVFTEALYENGWLSELEYSLYQAWYWPIMKTSPTLIPHGFIYLRAAPETCFRRLQFRARGEELDVDIAYLECLHDKHEKWLIPPDLREH
ncbi:P-loop containing nucleoside triphosphate hydrolase protein [Ostreococcus tauri]|uniref:P-loop containing nucleoside triphosphate hydrolase protein n=1 Tax=Ostreococcus tauri TaxID=70448 RepID=A0A1Y5HXP8_OSTTA|nr:P-loop containing nucleoside triphosphate hydrolase protein [Ostreococcus tauri]